MKKRGRQKSNLAAALAGVATPVYAIDHRRRLVFFNAGCVSLTGFTADDVLGRVCEYRSDGETDVERFVNGLCPPPAAFEGEEQAVPVFLPRRGDPSTARRIVFHPLVESDGRVPLVLAVVTELPIASRSEARTPATVRLHAELAAVRAKLRRRYGRDSLVGVGPAMQRVLDQVDLACRSGGPVLVVGPRGSGRTHVARVIHMASSKPIQQFVPLDCAALSPAELKRTLRRLLHEVGDERSSAGLQPGTLLLQNAAALPRDLQELVAERYRLDEPARPLPRLMATTLNDPTVDHERDVLADEYFYLLSRFPIRLPSLVDRRDDLEPLATAFLEATNRGTERQLRGFDPEVWTEFRRYHWPGNVAELKSVIEAARELAESDVIGLEDLPFAFRAGVQARGVGPIRRAQPCELDPLLVRVESEQIRLALTESRYNKSRAAELLGITRARLYRRMEQLGIGDAAESAPPEDGQPTA